MKLIVSSGHGKYVRGASGYLDEVDEARRVVENVADILRLSGVGVDTFHDDTSTTQSENLETIVNFHNSKVRDLDISVHFNAYQTTDKPMGCECLYVTQQTLAGVVSAKLSEAGSFIDRGAKQRTDLYFLNNTEMPAVLIEVCFVDSSTDADLYNSNFDDICGAIAEGLTGMDISEPSPPERPDRPPRPERPPPTETPEPDVARVDITIKPTGNVAVYINGQQLMFGKTTGVPEPYE